MTYPDSVKFLYSLGNELRGIKLGLERITALLEGLGNPQSACRFVHVAGTNGKGSTCAMIESGLRAAGRRTGLFTSPHLVEPTERIRIAGVPVSHQRFAEAFDIVHAKAEELLAGGALDAHPSYFETVTAMALVLYRQERVEDVVFEVGLGGRLDATNVVRPHLAVITAVDFDHEAYLGKSLEAIAAEKAGILKPGCAALLAPQRQEADQVLEAHAAAAGIAPLRARDWQARDIHLDPWGSRFEVVSPLGRRFRIECPLAGEHQVANALTAAAALEYLEVAPELIAAGIRATRWPGRLERVAASPEIILDGAHNPAGARALAAYLTRFHSHRRVWLIFGAMRDKAVAEMSGILFPLAAEVILTAPAQPRAVRPETVRELADHPRLRIAPRIQDALAMVEGAPAGDLVLISGSLFLVGEARALLVQ